MALESQDLQLEIVALRNTQALTLVGEDFGAGYAQVALARGLCTRFRFHGHTLTHTDIAQMGLTPLKAWNLAAAQAQQRARTSLGIQVHRRPATALDPALVGGLQLRIPGTSMSTWLAHPETLQFLNNYAMGLLEQPPVFLLPQQNVLVAMPKERAHAAGQWIAERARTGLGAAVPGVLQERDGFPTFYSAESPRCAASV